MSATISPLSSSIGTSPVLDHSNSPPAALIAGRQPLSKRSRTGLDALNFFLADVQTGVGPFLAVYLAGMGWNPQRVGVALTIGGLAGIIAQTPAGAMVDRTTAKRTLIAVGIVALAIGSFVIAMFPNLWTVLGAQVLIGSTSSVFIPAVVAISLGMVGAKALDRRQGRNQAFNAAGNVTAAISMGVLAYYTSNRSIFLLVVGLAIPALLTLLLLNPKEIDHNAARGAAEGEDCETAGHCSWTELLRDRPLVMFLIAAVLFHFANAAMLPLLGEMLAHGKAEASALFMTACVVTTQLVVMVLAVFVGRLAESRGRKWLLLIAFAVMPIRGVLYTVVHGPAALIAVQILDGVAAGIFGIVSVLVIADLTRGTGRFNLAQGAIATAVGIGAALSQSIAGGIVHRMGYNAGFLFLSAVALVAVAVLFFGVPETGTNARTNQ